MGIGKAKTEASEDISPALFGNQLKLIKRELELMYKDLIRVMFDETPVAGRHESTVSKDDIIPLERKINTLIMKIND